MEFRKDVVGMRWLLIVLVVLAGAAAFVILQNQAALMQMINLAVGPFAFSVTLRDLILGLAGGWVLMLLAAALDLGSARAAVARQQKLVAQREAELTRVKADAYDRDHLWLEESRAKLVEVHEEMQRLRARVEDALRVTEFRSPPPDAPARPAEPVVVRDQSTNAGDGAVQRKTEEHPLKTQP